MKTRLLTISEQSRPSTNYRGLTMVPFIRMSGKWLQAAGFDPGDSIRVEIEYGRLVISKLSLPAASELTTKTNNQARKERK